MTAIAIAESAPLVVDPNLPRRWTIAEFLWLQRHDYFTGEFAELVEGEIHIATRQGKLWSIDEFFRLCDADIFEGRRLELIEGEIYEMPNQHPRHSKAIGRCEKALRQAFNTGFWFRCQLPLPMGLKSDPNPDWAIVAGDPDDYDSHPTSALLIVEVSDSTLSFDKREKASLYAAGGIQDYWIIDLNNRQLILHRQPVADATQPSGFRYDRVSVIPIGDSVRPLAKPDAEIPIADLLS